MENNTVIKQDPGSKAGNEKELSTEKTFTQQEVDQIVQKRLARSKTEQEYSRRESDLAKRELMLDAREALADAGLPRDLINAINCTDKETMVNSIKAIQDVIDGIKNDGSGKQAPMPVIVAPSSNPSDSESNKIRKAMGLKR